ncbi:MAG: hypothetical protein JHC95_16095 [Solirubrobacteraceae bacterium]|nr:hypothetical protein [Solirubrobacteraceae bacterium]
MARLLPVLIALLVLAAVPAAHAIVRLPIDPQPVAHNPAERLVDEPIEESEYDGATRCLRTRRPGVDAMVSWLEVNARGQFWGSFRCELWGEGSASLHAEGRAIDWHLNVKNPADKAAAQKLIRLLLAPDSAGEPQALARRMGVQELIWDCGIWTAHPPNAGAEEFSDYRDCFGKDGVTPRKRVSATIAHRDHIHIGMTKAGAMGRTSFWRD